MERSDTLTLGTLDTLAHFRHFSGLSCVDPLYFSYNVCQCSFCKGVGAYIRGPQIVGNQALKIIKIMAMEPFEP